MLALHPTDDCLRDFLLGKLPDPDQSGVEEHLAECDECGDRAASIRADDTLTELLAAAHTRVDTERADAPTPSLLERVTWSFAATRVWDGELPAGADDPDPPPELAAHPKYRVLGRLGAGGMGSVWLAEHAVMDRPVAVKVIRPELLARRGAADRFLREVRAAAKLHHPNIVTAFDAEQVGASCLLVIEYVPGETLAEVVKAGPLPVAEACRAARDAACGLAHAHAAGLVHRDVKPGNLIRTADGATKVLDFGLVVADPDREAGLTGENMVIGTPDYIAPEQAVDARAADARADVYALGCTLYHLLAGRLPFPTGSVLQKLDAHRTAASEPIAGVLPELAAVVAKMMAKDPDDRYQSAAEVAEALEPFCGPGERAGSVSPRSRRRRRLRVAIAAGLVCGLVAVGVWAGQEVIIRDKDGKVVGKHPVPPGGSIEVKPGPAAPAAAAPDEELIKGSWRPVAGEISGEAVPKEFVDMMQGTLTFADGKVTWRVNPPPALVKALEGQVGKGPVPKELPAALAKGEEGVYHLDPTKTPKTIDVTLLGPIRKTMLGIYALDGDTLKVCMAIDPDRTDQRPTDFVTRPGVMTVAVTARRLPAPPVAPKP